VVERRRRVPTIRVSRDLMLRPWLRHRGEVRGEIRGEMARVCSARPAWRHVLRCRCSAIDAGWHVLLCHTQRPDQAGVVSDVYLDPAVRMAGADPARICGRPRCPPLEMSKVVSEVISEVTSEVISGAISGVISEGRRQTLSHEGLLVAARPAALKCRR